jgi:hypothetical protein
MGNALRLHISSKYVRKLLLLLALLSSAHAAKPWSVAFGGCAFSGDYDGAPLIAATMLFATMSPVRTLLFTGLMISQQAFISPPTPMQRASRGPRGSNSSVTAKGSHALGQRAAWRILRLAALAHHTYQSLAWLHRRAARQAGWDERCGGGAVYLCRLRGGWVAEGWIYWTLGGQRDHLPQAGQRQSDAQPSKVGPLEQVREQAAPSACSLELCACRKALGNIAWVCGVTMHVVGGL